MPQNYIANEIKSGHTNKIPGFFSPKLKRKWNSLHMPRFSYLFRGRHSNSLRQMWGRNFAFWKDDFIKVNGFEESFEGWGHEDKEFALRLKNCGLKRRTLINCAI